MKAALPFDLDGTLFVEEPAAVAASRRRRGSQQPAEGE
jgi:hypothetical protein